MASSPRTGRSSNAAIVALLIGLILVVGVVIAAVSGFNLAAAGEQIVRSLYPQIAVTSQGERIRELYTIVFLIAAVIFFVVEGLIIWTVVRYRRKPTDDELPVQTHGNAIAEIVWTVVPTLIVAFLFVISWQTLNTVDTTAAQPDVKLRAVAGQFQWTFEYLPNDLEPTDNPLKAPLYTEFVPSGEDGGLHVPTGKTVKLYLTSLDVIHAFYVPQFLFKRDVVPGRTNVFEFNVNDSDAGQTFRGQCAELCGSGHRIMLFDVHALAPADFDAWLQDKVANAPPPAPSGAAPSGAAPSGPVASGPAPSGPAPSGPAPSAGGAGPTLAIAAQNVAYDVNALQAPANTPFQIAFDNKDNAVPHNVAIHQGSPTGPEVFKGEIFPGPATKTYDVPALPAGTYAFVCSVHANMTGTLTVN